VDEEADEILEDEQLLDLIYEQLGRRHPQSRKRGRNSTPSEVVLRLMKQISDLVGAQGTRLRDRLRTIGHRVMEIARLSRCKGQEQKTKMQEKYRELVRLARQVRNQAQRFLEEIHSGVKRAVNPKQQAVLGGMKQELDAMIPLLNQVLRQTTARVFRGVTDTPGKILSVFEPTAEIIRKGKVSKPTEFGKLVKIQEAENQIITHYAVCRQRPADSTLLLGAVRLHQQRLGRAPELLAGHAGFYSAENEREAHALGVQRVSIPNRSTHSAARRQHQKKRRFGKGQKWRTGCEGRISVLKRRALGIGRGMGSCCRRLGLRPWLNAPLFRIDRKQHEMVETVPAMIAVTPKVEIEFSVLGQPQLNLLLRKQDRSVVDERMFTEELDLTYRAGQF